MVQISQAHALPGAGAPTATATAADALPQAGHPDYRPVEPPARWRERLHLAGSECSPTLGGYIEGALAAAAIAVGRNG